MLQAKKPLLIAVLDKAAPPEHSFVDGMLASQACAPQHYRVLLLVSRGANSHRSIFRYRRAICLPLMFPRRGIWRFVNLGRGWLLLSHLLTRAKRRERRAVLLVRNEPIHLLAAAIARRHREPIVFQSSHPHEETNPNPLKRFFAKIILRSASKSVDALLAVSPVGEHRLRRLFPHARRSSFIPLLSDKPTNILAPTPRKKKDNNTHFIYAGTHAPRRNLDVVLTGISKSMERGANATFTFVGGTTEQIDLLRLVSNTAQLEQRGIVTFKHRMPRHAIWSELSSADVGLSLAPPTNQNQEMSPTKLAEYMGMRLAILANYGIPMQEQFVRDSGAGLLVKWASEDIASGILTMSRDFDLEAARSEAYSYAKEKLKYSSYLDELLFVCEGSSGK